MTWQKWALVALYVFSALTVVSRIGKPREPFTPKDAVFNLVVSAGIVALVVTA